MTNRHMVKPAASAKPAAANDEPVGSHQTPLPPMPAPEDSRTPTTDQEPIDSPQPNASGTRAPPAPGEIGLATQRKS